MINSKTFRIGILVDNKNCSLYDYETFKYLKQINNIEIFILNQKIEPKESTILKKFISIISSEGIISLSKKILWNFIILLEKQILKKTIHNKHFMRHNLSNEIDNIVTINPIISKNAIFYRFSEADIKKVLSLNLDIILRFGSGILKGKILNSARLGILSVHHGDNNFYRGGPAGFWEIYQKNPRTGFILQILTETLDAGKILMRGNFPTKTYFLLNQAEVMMRSNYYIQRLLLDIIIEKKLPETEVEKHYKSKIYKLPLIKEQIIYISYLFKISIKKIFARKDIWHVAFQNKNWKKIGNNGAITLKNPTNRFLADPFLIRYGNKNFCFVEDYHLKNNKGKISVYELKLNSYSYLGTALEEPFHLSFPYIFKFNSKIYMVPESSENMDIRIYEAIKFPLKWKLKKVIFKNISSADNIIFHYNNLWWLFSNIDRASNSEHCSELSIFYADNPIKGEWKPHKKNPIFLDPFKARNAGIIFDGQNILRVNQVIDFRQYGKKTIVNKIKTLNKNKYVEETIKEINSDIFNNAIATHHLSSIEELTTFDYICKT